MPKWISKQLILTLTMIVVVLYPIIELDYLAYETLSQWGLPRFTTIFKLIVLPSLVVCTFMRFETNKKRLLTFVGGYGVVFAAYFVLHYMNADSLQYSLRLTPNFALLLSDEILYFITIMLPLAYVWVFYSQEIGECVIKKVTIGLSCVISLPILISNLFVFGFSTYDGYSIDNIFSWFSLPFNETTHHPRLYATKFFFEEGNTIGIIMLMLLPFLYYFLFKAHSKKEKGLLTSLIVCQSLSMIILSTRIATYGALLVPIAMIAIQIVLVIFKEIKFKPIFTLICALFIAMNALIIPYGPAQQNQLLDAADYGFIKGDESHRTDLADTVRREGEDLEAFSTEWINFYVFMFEEYSYLIGVTPPIYYTKWYDYRHDPKFWVDLIMDYELEERVSGRQVQKIFMDYKYDQLTTYQKFMGLGYGTFMRGSIILEKDFAQQMYTLGYIGFALVLAPWLLIGLYLGLKLLFGLKKGAWNYLNIVLMMSYCLGLVGAYVSGHTIDEIPTSLFIALCAGVLWKRLEETYEK